LSAWIARAEANTVLQWLFAVIVGSLGAIDATAPQEHWLLVGGFIAAAGCAAGAAMALIREMASRDTLPSGNYSEALKTLLNEPLHRMRWREARGMDGRIETNRAAANDLAAAVDKARGRLALLPAWFIGGIVATWLLLLLYGAIPQWQKYLTAWAAA
jgi:hypothetical protein